MPHYKHVGMFSYTPPPPKRKNEILTDQSVFTIKPSEEAAIFAHSPHFQFFAQVI